MPAFKCECKYHDCKITIYISQATTFDPNPILCDECKKEQENYEKQADGCLHRRNFPNGREPFNF